MSASRRLAALAPAVLLAALAAAAPAPANTIGLLLHDPGAFDGYTLFESFSYTETYLIDNDGRLVHSWQHQYVPGFMAYLLENGHLLRGANPGSPWFQQGGGAGLVQEVDWDGNLLWEFAYSSSQHRHHHDCAPLPNGNVLLLAWELKSGTEAITQGRDPSKLLSGVLWPEHIVEVQPVGADSGVIVWEWHVWDHLVQDFDMTKANYAKVGDHPELVDINFLNGGNGGRDWLHMNAIAYNADLDQIVVSVNQFSEFWIIDHGTTTAEAAGHTGGARGRGGDILYRWGNPQAYGAGNSVDRRLYNQHDVHWIPNGLSGAGNILLFSNGSGRPGGSYSTVEEIQTSVDANGDYPVPAVGAPHGPASSLWTYTASPPASLFSAIISSAQRLPNGNTLICEGAPSGTFHEIDTQDALVWQYVNPVNTNGPMMQDVTPMGNATFRITRYAPDYPAFAGKDLTPGAPIEIYPNTGAPVVARAPAFELRNAPNPFVGRTEIGFSLPGAAPVALDVYDVAGRHLDTVVDGPLAAGEHRFSWRARGPSGVYFYRLRVGQRTAVQRMVVRR